MANEVSDQVEQELQYLKKRIDEKSHFDEKLILELLDRNFSTYLSIFRLFLEYSKDEFEGLLRERLAYGIGIKAFRLSLSWPRVLPARIRPAFSGCELSRRLQ